MKLDDYLSRISFDGDARPDLATLTAVHRLHANAIPFEDIDVQLGRTVTLDVAAAFDKLVRRRRGGWCYEQNGLLGWALSEIGFEVMRITCGVMRETLGDVQVGNHLALVVRIDDAQNQRWLCDVGFGGSLAGPIALEPSERRDPPYRLGLRETGDGFWRFWEEAAGDAPFSFDFRDAPADEALMAQRCVYLQTSPKSSFVQSLVVQQRRGDTHTTLRGRVLSETGTQERRTLATERDLVDVLSERFNLFVPEAADLWPAICARHEALGLP